MSRSDSVRQPQVTVRPELVRGQLERILTSRLFARSESLKRLLRHVVEETLAGNAASLREYSLGVDVFSRGDSFDPRCDTIVRVQARKLRAKLDEYYRNAGPADLVRIEITKGSYVPIFDARQSSAGIESPGAGRRMPQAIAGIAVLILLSVWLAHPPRTQPTRGKAISEAWDQYRKAQYCWAKGDVLSTRQAISFYQKAIAADPSFADGYAGLSTAYGALGDNNRAAEMALRGVALDEKSSRAHSALALALLRRWNSSLAEQEARRGVQLDPGNPAAYHILANVMVATGQTSDAIRMIRQARDLEPLSWRHNLRLAEILVFDRDYTRAADQFRGVLEVEPNFRRAWLGLVISLTLSGDHLEASRTLERYGAAGGDDALACSALISARLGNTGAARRLLADLEARSKDQSVLLPSIAAVYGALDDPDAALYYLDKAAAIRLPSLPETLRHPMFDSLRSHPHFRQLLEKMNARVS